MAPSIDSVKVSVVDGAVETQLSYLESVAEEQLHVYAYARPGSPAGTTNGTFKDHPIRVHSMRSGASFSVDKNGFQLSELHTDVVDWDSDDKIKDEYYPAVEKAIRAAVPGLDKVFIFDHTLRRNTSDADTNAAKRKPVMRVHNDYTEASGPQRVRDLLPEEEAERRLKGHFAIIQVWRPLKGPVEESPLAVADSSTTSSGDFVDQQIFFPNRTGNVYSIKYNPNHRWYYAPGMEAHEAYVFKCFDSDKNARTRFTPHSAFLDPTSPPDAAPRESIEVRAIAFWPLEE